MKALHIITILFCVVFSTSITAQNTWTQLPDFAGSDRYEGFSFQLDTDNDGIDDKGFIGAGWNGGANNFSDFWQYDHVTGAWTQLANYNGQGKRQFAVFVLNNVAYVAGGAFGGNSVANELWAYDGVANTWTQKNDLPIGSWGGSAFVVNGKAYLTLGNRNGSITSPQNSTALYEYVPATDTWITKNDVPFTGRFRATVLQLDTDLDGETDKVLIGCGAERNGTYLNDIWEYLPATDTWVQKGNHPVDGIAVHFNILDKGYTGLGADGSTSNSLYEYNYQQDTWTRMSDHPGIATRGAYSFVLDNEAFVACGNTTQGVVSQFYKYAPLLNGYSEIHGKVFADGDGDCLLGTGEFSVANIPIMAMPGQYLTSTDEFGDYTFRVPVGSYDVNVIVPTHLTQVFPGVNCPASGTYPTIVIDTIDIDTSGFDFALNALLCPRLNVQIASNSRLRCFVNNTVISYCNYGLVDEDSVYIVLSLPSFVTIVSASEAFTALGNDEYEFYIGNVAAGTCGQIDLVDEVSCADVMLLGAAACSEVRIFPNNTCLPTDPIWNGANVEISAECLAPSDTIALTITNTGTNAMADSSELRVYLDGSLGYTENFQIGVGETYTLFIPSNGATIMAEADQAVGHPFNSQVVTWIERCRVDTPQTPLFTIIPDLPLGDDYEQFDVECIPVSGSYDPNDKQAFPSGVTPANIIPPGTTINYKLRFQNTGNGVAFNVYLVDTLDANLDIASLRINAASHAYRMELSGQGKNIVTFYFDNIMLVDSNVSQLESQGFVSFSIAPKTSTQLGTVIENFADIYFDFNPPIRTNTVNLTIDNLPVNEISIKDGNVLVLGAKNIVEGKQQLYMYPNPADNVLNVVTTFPSSGQADLIIVDLLGRALVTETYYGTAGNTERIGIDLSQLLAGVYVVVINRDGAITTGKVVKE